MMIFIIFLSIITFCLAGTFLVLAALYKESRVTFGAWSIFFGLICAGSTCYILRTIEQALIFTVTVPIVY